MSSRVPTEFAVEQVLYAEPTVVAAGTLNPSPAPEIHHNGGAHALTKTADPHVDRTATQPTDAAHRRNFNWLDAVLETMSGKTASKPSPARQWLKRFLEEPELGAALQLWAAHRFAENERPTRQSIVRRLAQELAELDQVLARQVNCILHHPRFQQLEASWRGIWYLTGQARENLEFAEFDESPPDIRIQLISISKRQLRSDLENAVEFDQSQFFKRIHDTGFGIAGGFPFGAIIGDYEFTNHIEDIDCLDKISEVAAAAFCPFIASAAPELLGLENFRSLERVDIEKLDQAIRQQVDYLKWRSFRANDDSRFVGLTLPRVLMREPYLNDGTRVDGFRFREEVEGLDQSRYLWGSAAYPFGAVLLRAFASSRWFADIRGFQRGVLGGGLVTGLPVNSFVTDRRGVSIQGSTDVAITDIRENKLSELGFIPLCRCQDTEYSVFLTNASTQEPKDYSTDAAKVNSRISAMLQYVLCASRFAHYLKILARNRLGSLVSDIELQRELRRWISAYVAPQVGSSANVKAKYPLREANIEVTEIANSPGKFKLIMQLLPHYQLDGLSASLKLVMKMSPPTGN